jgi:hypothetical protein
VHGLSSRQRNGSHEVNFDRVAHKKAKGKGADFPELIRNLGRNLAKGWVGTLSAALERTV